MPEYFLQSQKFTYTKTAMPLNNLGKPRWWCHSIGSFWLRLTYNIWVNCRHTCGYILRHTSNTLLPCVTSWENQKKPAKMSGRELWTSTSLVHPWIQFPGAWRCQVHLLKQLYASINHGNVQPSYRSGRNWVLSLRDECVFVHHLHINLRTEAKDLWRCWLKLARVPPNWLQTGLMTIKSMLWSGHHKARISFI